MSQFPRDHALAVFMQNIVEVTTRRVLDTVEIDNEFEIAMSSLRIHYENEIMDIEQDEASAEANRLHALDRREAEQQEARIYDEIMGVNASKVIDQIIKDMECPCNDTETACGCSYCEWEDAHDEKVYEEITAYNLSCDGGGD